MLPNPDLQAVTPVAADEKPKLNPDKIRYLLSMTLIVIGAVVLLTQLFPLGVSIAQGALVSRNNQAQYKPVSDNFLSSILNPQYYDPGVSYFQNLLAQNNIVSDSGSGGNVLGASDRVVIDRDYQKEMQVTIPSLDINNIRIAPNVNSYDDKVYNEALKGGVAHFRGTPLPGAGGNSFIYGHSGIGNFWQVNKPELIFSRLEKIQIGDTIKIKKDDTLLNYTVIKKQIIDESNLKVLQSIPGKDTVTLMTCWPLGIGSQRLIVVAERH